MTSCQKRTDQHLLFSRFPRYLLLPLMLYQVHPTTALVTLIILFVFLRSPDRIPRIENRNDRNDRNDDIYSPADGTILDIEENTHNIVVSIFLSVFDVHVQYSPVDGKIVRQKYVRGEFHPAFLTEKSKYNERLLTDIRTRDGNTITVIQIAGQIANRIESFVKTGDAVTTGCKLGIIKFGSRVNIVVPRKEGMYRNVKIGDYVTAGETILISRQKRRIK